MPSRKGKKGKRKREKKKNDGEPRTSGTQSPSSKNQPRASPISKPSGSAYFTHNRVLFNGWYIVKANLYLSPFYKQGEVSERFCNHSAGEIRNISVLKTADRDPRISITYINSQGYNQDGNAYTLYSEQTVKVCISRALFSQGSTDD